MTAFSAAAGARRTLEKFVAGAELLKLLDGQVTTKTPEDMHNILCLTARLVQEAASGGACKTEALDTSAARCTIPDLTFTTPWGKFSLLMLDEMLVLTNAKTEIRVPFHAIKRVAILDRFPKDTKERVVLFIVLDKAAGVMSGKNILESLVLQVLATNTLKVQVSGDAEPLEGPTPVVLCSILGRAGVDASAFASPDDDIYVSATGGPALTATFKANSGWLYPLEDALYFVERPPMYFPHEEIASYELQRVDGSLSTFELVLRMKGSKAAPVDFTISRQELGRLQTYLERSRLKVFGSEQAAAPGKAGAKTAPAVDAGDEEDETEEGEEEDEDFDPEASDDSCGPANPRPSKRTRRGEVEEAGPSSRAAEGGGDEGESESAASGGSSDEDEDEDEDESGSVDYTDEEDIPASAIKAKIKSEKAEQKSERRK